MYMFRHIHRNMHVDKTPVTMKLFWLDGHPDYSDTSGVSRTDVLDSQVKGVPSGAASRPGTG